MRKIIWVLDRDPGIIPDLIPGLKKPWINNLILN